MFSFFYNISNCTKLQIFAQFGSLRDFLHYMSMSSTYHTIWAYLTSYILSYNYMSLSYISYRAFLRGGVYDHLKPQTHSTRTDRASEWETESAFKHAGKMMPYKSLHSQLGFKFFIVEVCWNGPDRQLLVHTLHYSLAPLIADFIYVDKVLEERFLSCSTSQISCVSVHHALEETDADRALPFHHWIIHKALVAAKNQTPYYNRTRMYTDILPAHNPWYVDLSFLSPTWPLTTSECVLNWNQSIKFDDNSQCTVSRSSV